MHFVDNRLLSGHVRLVIRSRDRVNRRQRVNCLCTTFNEENIKTQIDVKLLKVVRMTRFKFISTGLQE